MQDRNYHQITTKDLKLCVSVCVCARLTSSNDPQKYVHGNELGYEIIEINAAHNLQRPPRVIINSIDKLQSMFNCVEEGLLCARVNMFAVWDFSHNACVYMCRITGIYGDKIFPKENKT